LCSNHVFKNCPFDVTYKPIFDAIVFAVDNLGFVARCALEVDDSGEVRLSKIERIIEECKFGIHEISAVSVDPATRLPRFNMPLELGLFLGCQRYEAVTQAKKASLVLDNEQYRYRIFTSDIAGQDIHAMVEGGSRRLSKSAIGSPASRAVGRCPEARTSWSGAIASRPSYRAYVRNSGATRQISPLMTWLRRLLSGSRRTVDPHLEGSA
jgi:hypothetical protein